MPSGMRRDGTGPARCWARRTHVDHPNFDIDVFLDAACVYPLSGVQVLLPALAGASAASPTLRVLRCSCSNSSARAVADIASSDAGGSGVEAAHRDEGLTLRCTATETADLEASFLGTLSPLSYTFRAAPDSFAENPMLQAHFASPSSSVVAEGRSYGDAAGALSRDVMLLRMRRRASALDPATLAGQRHCVV